MAEDSRQPHSNSNTNDDDAPRPRERVDYEDIRRALEEQRRNRPPRPPVNQMPEPIPRLHVEKPKGRRRRKP